MDFALFRCLDCSKTFLGHNKGKCHGCGKPRLQLVETPQQNAPQKPHGDGDSRKYPKQKPNPASADAPPKQGTSRKRKAESQDLESEEPHTLRHLADRLRLNSVAPSTTSEEKIEKPLSRSQRKRAKKAQHDLDSAPSGPAALNYDDAVEESVEADQSTHPYCMHCHMSHLSSAECKKKGVKPSPIQKAPSILRWKETFSEEDFASCVVISEASTTFAHWYNFLTCSEASLHGLEAFPRWNGDRDVLQWKVLECAKKKLCDEDYAFLVDITNRSNHISMKLFNAVRSKFKTFLDNEFIRKVKAAMKESGLTPNDADWKSRTQMYNDVKSNWADLGLVKIPDFFDAQQLENKILRTLRTLVTSRDEAVKQLRLRVMAFQWKHSKEASKVVNDCHTDFCLPMDLVLQCRILPNGLLAFNLPDLVECFKESKFYLESLRPLPVDEDDATMGAS